MDCTSNMDLYIQYGFCKYCDSIDSHIERIFMQPAKYNLQKEILYWIILAVLVFAIKQLQCMGDRQLYICLFKRSLETSALMAEDRCMNSIMYNYSTYSCFWIQHRYFLKWTKYIEIFPLLCFLMLFIGQWWWRCWWGAEHVNPHYMYLIQAQCSFHSNSNTSHPVNFVIILRDNVTTCVTPQSNTNW